MFNEGQTATNPKTGQKIVFRGGQWVNAGTAPGSVSAKRLTPQEQIQLKEAREAAGTSDEAARMAEQFVELNKQQGSGQLWAIPGTAAVAGAFDPEIAQMNSLTAKMAPAQRVPGSGTTSDRDLSLYLQAVPGMNRPGPANAAIARQAREDAQRRADRAAFMDRYAAERGTLQGADEAYRARSSTQRPATARPQPKTSGKGWRIVE